MGDIAVERSEFFVGRFNHAAVFEYVDSLASALAVCGRIESIYLIALLQQRMYETVELVGSRTEAVEDQDLLIAFRSPAVSDDFGSPDVQTDGIVGVENGGSALSPGFWGRTKKREGFFGGKARGEDGQRSEFEAETGEDQFFFE